MDTHVKEGQLYVQHQKFGKKWKKNWFVLYPASQNGIARLEFFESSGSGGVGGGSGGNSNEKSRKLDKKIIRLSECISILPALTENCPKDNMAAFCVETNDKTHVFAAEKNAAKEWMNTMCDIAFQGGSGGNGDSDAESQDLKMSENLIYYSREDVNEFWVSVQRTEASDRCRLSGNYWLKAESNVLILKEPKTKRNVFVWPYKLLRRYGRDRVMFSIESGRRCDSGPGNFTFDTKQGNEIFTLVDQAIKSQKALAEERPLSCPVSFDPECPPSLQHIRNAGAPAPASGDSSSCSSWEADGDSGGSKPGSADGVLGKREGGDGGGGARGPASAGAERQKGRSLPELPAIPGRASGGNTPPRSPRGQGAAKCLSSATKQAALYSEPADAVRLPAHTADGLYSDPVDSITIAPLVQVPRLRPVVDESSGGGAQTEHHHGNESHSTAQDLYSHVYDHISLELSQKTDAMSLNGAGNAGGGGGRCAGRGLNSNKRTRGTALSPAVLSLEHIYDEPEGCAKGFLNSSNTSGMTIYNEARLEPYSQKRRDEVATLTGTEVTYSTPTHGKSSFESHKHSPPNRGGQHPPAPRWPKPVTAPKPVRGNFARREPVPLPPGKHGEPDHNVNNNNNNNIRGREGGGEKELYSQVTKPSKLWSNHSKATPLSSPDIIYDNLGNI
ncbi:docking protein 1b [Hippocampus zosterae]|uniref:docking protein 1b n=1 Tax=Hippocampus zosterae TaxID=109293 RepID=UPI00223DE914|nr:docking protein 1b [Hippocampus zosterae]